MPTDTLRERAPDAGDDVLLQWSVHLARDCPAKLVASLLLVALCIAAGYYTMGLLGAVVVAGVMAASLADFLFPISYAITADGASCRMLLKSSAIRWSDVKRCWVDDLGVKLSPLNRKSRLEAFRGVYLRFAQNREQVTELVKELRERVCLE